MSLIHGSTGIIYFAHVMESSRFSETGLLDDKEMAAEVKKTNEQIQRLAPVLNSPTVPGSVTVAAEPSRVSKGLAETLGGGPVPTMAKRHGGATYVFAVNMENWPVSGTFQVKGLSGGAGVEVIDEGRKLDAKDGAFTDQFEPYAVHLYRIGR